MRELIMQLNCHFTDADKEKCMLTVHKLINLSRLACNEGILALELEAEQESNIFLKTALLLIVDGIDPVTVEQMLQNLIFADKYSGSQLLDRLLMTEGVLAIQQGEHPYVIRMKLCSMLGENYILSKEDDVLIQNEKIREYYASQEKLKNKVPLPESLQLKTKLERLDNKSIQCVLRQEIDMQDLLMALYGCEINLIYKVLDNLSIRLRSQFCESLEIYTPIYNEPVLAAQEKLLKIIERLEDRGEIIVY